MKRSKVNERCYILLQTGAASTAIVLVAVICLLTPIVGIADINARRQALGPNTATVETGALALSGSNKHEQRKLDADANETTAKVEQTREWQTVQMRVTAYCPCEKCCGKYSDGITASGHKIRPGDVFVAADREYAMRTEMIIAGYNNSEPVKVLDRGGAIRGDRLDVFFYTHQEALNWGVRYLDVKVRID
ncbi:MAG: 3D domain-containing protein [Sedimentisphaerales bacterium]|nr:3D domain-containing protein [Sedimentisphaerales bacterium]